MRKGYIRAASALTAVLMLLTACSAPGTEGTTETAKQTEKAEENRGPACAFETADSGEMSADNSLLPKTLKDLPEAAEDEVRAFMEDSDENTVLVDARAEEFYSGWGEGDGKSGGHLKNAVLFSSRWLDCPYSGKAERKAYLDRSMQEQGIIKGKKLIVYDRSGEEAKRAANYFLSEGVENIAIFHADGLLEEGKNESYPGYEHFVPAALVKSVSDVKTGAAQKLSAEAELVFGTDPSKIILIDVGWGNAEESTYLSKGHVPGAVHINTDSYERPRVYVPEKRSDYAKEWRLISLPEFRDSLCPQYGIRKDSVVILTGDATDPQAKLGFLLRSLGVKVYVMSGKLSAWTYADYPLDKGSDSLVIPSSAEDFGSDQIENPGEIIWMDAVKRILSGEEEGQIVDNRSEKEWKGEYSGYDYHDLAGRIDKTIWCLENEEKAGEFFENVDGTPRTQAELRAYMEKSGIDTGKTTAFFCGDSWGAAKIAYWCQAVGLENIKEWGEGWIPWSNLGNEFIDHSGRKVHYEKYRDTVLDEDGKDVRDGVNILDSAGKKD